MTTPEGRVKAKVKKAINELPRSYMFWPVQTGLGATTLDCLACINGWFVAIETKAVGNKMTPRQKVVAEQICKSRGLAYCVATDDDIKWMIKDIELKCYPQYSVQQGKAPNGTVEISPLVLSRR